MQAKLISIFKYTLGLALGGLLFYFAFKDISIAQLRANFAAARWEWLAVSMSFSLLSHALRGARWQMLLQASGHPVNFMVCFSSVMFTYLVNLAFPRAGEVARCTALYRREKIPVATSLGTVLTERLIDVIMLGIFLVITFFLASPLILAFVGNAQQSAEAGGSSLFMKLAVLAAAGLMGLVLLWVFRRKLLALPLMQKIVGFLTQLWEAIWSIRKVSNRLLFVLYSVGIWLCYWMMMYTGLYCFEPIAAQSSAHNLLVFSFIGTVIGSLGMILPIPGGIGPYHQAIIFTFVALQLFPDEAMSRNMGQTFAFAFHTAQMLVMIVGGGLGYAYLMVGGRKVKM